ncbi:putative replication factor C subunit 5-like [Capsicum annuum]|uniref:probable polygalacturonase n=1 Tax=Capsicum annuum TaxID=4072 RepID=UPI001FB10065|nr:probable polygalacturonase [Capsicum annuum]KAF3632660.1 putative replication factor C subunit 5-like [Capsicum annuum]KAF3680251.1 putative replication factor C subunit 5-like [Capsicum annuum]
MEEKIPILNKIKGGGGGGITRPLFVFSLLLFFTLVALFSLQINSEYSVFSIRAFDFISGRVVSIPDPQQSCSGFFEEVLERKVVKSIKDFGGIGDGKTLNTAAFRRAIEFMARFKASGGSQLVVPKGRWVTGSFNLTSNFTLFLQHGAVILGSQDPNEWPIIEALPSYGRGRERLGARHISLIHGNGLSNVVITGENGTIDGQGKMWWELWWNRTLVHTRGHLVELVNSQNILIQNLTLLNSPFWTIHPVYCRNIVIRNMTILAPLNAPNTDGIDADSSLNVCIEDCYIESGDDLVSVKSGWDQYGMKIARPSSNIIVRRVRGTTPTCSGVGIGSEMSGGVSNVIIEDLHVRDSAAGVRIKTDIGRGGYIANVTINNMRMERVKVPIRFSRGANDHPDDKWDPKALPKVRGIFISNVVSLETKRPPLLEGIEEAPFEDIHMKNISLFGLAPSMKWNCEFISGSSCSVFPAPCSQLLKNEFQCPN